MIKREVVIFIAILLATICSSRAQLSVGIDTGYSSNHLSTDISKSEFTTITNERGYSIGLQINYYLTNLLGLQTGVNLLQKNYSFARTGHYVGVYEMFTNSYFQVPIAVILKIFERKKIQIFFSTGVYGAYWAFAKVNGATPNIFNSSNTVLDDGQIIQNLSLTNYLEKYQFNSVKDNRFEFGLNTGISIHYELNNKYSTFIESFYDQSLTDQQKKYMINQISKINQTLCISIGCLMKFSTNKK